MDGWKMYFLLGRPIFGCYVSFKECKLELFWHFLEGIPLQTITTEMRGGVPKANLQLDRRTFCQLPQAKLKNKESNGGNPCDQPVVGSFQFHKF